MTREEAFVVSDLHLGAGDVEPQLEDFRQDDALAGFIDSIARAGVTLFINGDFVDFPQIPPYDVAGNGKLLWSEATSLAKVDASIKSHPAPFSALARFLAKGAEVVIHVGNHDLDMAWPAVQARLREAVGSPSEQALRFVAASSRYHGVHIEHGHMWTPENATAHAEDFIHEWPAGSGQRWLERVWGTDFMLRFYNDLERAHPFADNVKPMLRAAYYGIKNGWVGGHEVVRLLVFLKSAGVPFAAIAGSVLGGSEPGAGDVLGAFEEEHWQSAVAERAGNDPHFVAEIAAGIAALSAAEKAALGRGGRVKTEVAPQSAEPSATLGVFREDRELRAARDRLQADGVTHVIFGHTHEIVDGALGGALYNPGTWLPHLDLSSAVVKAKIAAHKGLSLEMLDDASLYVIKRTVAHIVPDPPNRSRVELITAP